MYFVCTFEIRCVTNQFLLSQIQLKWAKDNHLDFRSKLRFWIIQAKVGNRCEQVILGPPPYFPAIWDWDFYTNLSASGTLLN
jgi:hypothetical protein